MEGRRENLYFFKNFLKGVEENSKFYGEMYFWDYGGEIFGLSGRRDVIWNIP